MFVYGFICVSVCLFVSNTNLQFCTWKAGTWHTYGMTLRGGHGDIFKSLSLTVWQLLTVFGAILNFCSFIVRELKIGIYSENGSLSPLVTSDFFKNGYFNCH